VKLSLMVLGAPGSSQASATAYRFANCAIEQGHSLYRLFFYHDGVHNGSNLIDPPQDEINQPHRWQILSEKNNIDMVVCVASAARRGIVDAAEAKRRALPGANLRNGFDLSGLGQLVDATINSDRLITFGN